MILAERKNIDAERVQADLHRVFSNTNWELRQKNVAKYMAYFNAHYTTVFDCDNFITEIIAGVRNGILAHEVISDATKEI